jgi:protein-S-isoprenylcysteine O-methyltransferase Ste14
MKRLKTILLATLAGAAIGALATKVGDHFTFRSPALALDQASLAHHRYLIATIPWVLFSLYWEIAAKNAAAAKSAESRASRALHVTLANLAILLEVVPIRGLGRFLPATTLVLVVGLALEVFGLLLAVWARRVLGRNWSGEISIKVEHELIRSGPYKWLRHPIYTGILAMYLGTGVATGEWLAIVGIAIATIAYWRKIRLEEANLKVAFGADYAAYCRESWALFPGLF